MWIICDDIPKLSKSLVKPMFVCQSVCVPDVRVPNLPTISIPFWIKYPYLPLHYSGPVVRTILDRTGSIKSGLFFEDNGGQST